VAAESAHFEHLTGSAIIARIAEASIDFVLAIAAMIAGRTVTAIAELRLRHAVATVLTREGIADVALGQHTSFSASGTDKTVWRR